LINQPATETDGRRRRGDRTRQAVAVRAAERASIDGLCGVTLGQIAADLGISKGGIQAVFATKEELQLAAVAAATEIFVKHVVMPPLEQPGGLPRLRALIDAWLAYVTKRVLPGGCFMAATIPEFDSHPGPVREALAEARCSWLALLEKEAKRAQAQGELAADVPPAALAFEIDALLTMANNARNLGVRPSPIRTARAVLDARLVPPRNGARPGLRA
jgi:AcrR family transcriptional regulator